MAYEVPALPYDYGALEPHIDEQTMRVHHDKHHQAYVDKANGALQGTEWEDRPIEEVLRNLSALPADKRTEYTNKYNEFKKLRQDARDLHKKASDIARANPNIGKK